MLRHDFEATDSKYAKFRDLLLHQPPHEKIIVFAFFRATLQDLARRLAADGFKSVVKVIPLGSSQIELRVVENLRIPPDQRVLFTERLRQYKERPGGNVHLDGTEHAEFQRVREQLQKEVTEELMKTLAQAKEKIPARRQWRQMQFLFTGGAGGDRCYQNAVSEAYEFWHAPPMPQALPVPEPDKLEGLPAGPDERRKAFSRLSVAYGLSFPKANLDDGRYPDEVAPLPPDEPDDSNRPHAPTKDEC